MKKKPANLDRRKLAEPAAKAKPVSKTADAAYWAEVVEAMANKKTPPRRPRG